MGEDDDNRWLKKELTVAYRHKRKTINNLMRVVRNHQKYQEVLTNSEYIRRVEEATEKMKPQIKAAAAAADDDDKTVCGLLKSIFKCGGTCRIRCQAVGDLFDKLICSTRGACVCFCLAAVAAMVAQEYIYPDEKNRPKSYQMLKEFVAQIPS